MNPQRHTFGLPPELKPYLKWTVNIATSMDITSGMLTSATNAPARIARPPKSSRSGAESGFYPASWRGGARLPAFLKIRE
jgi:hypothetical protein